MNQAIQFPDREEWDALARKVRFPVLISGMLSECIISESFLYSRYGKQETALAVFQSHRWDLEEEFEALIGQGLKDENDVYMLSEDK
ncbi:DUF1488 domain-containing protein [Providencia sp. Je.9.19]|uniref:DUF1488 domain-containing protein n=1 Tax=Providencia sp. Je.9.19 TaxID=3142844 RepID=UPI003DA96299